MTRRASQYFELTSNIGDLQTLPGVSRLGVRESALSRAFEKDGAGGRLGSGVGVGRSLRVSSTRPIRAFMGAGDTAASSVRPAGYGTRRPDRADEINRGFILDADLRYKSHQI